MVVRHDVNVEAIGEMAALPPDLSPLRIGTKGEFDGLGFTLIGRGRLAHEEGSWSEWCALFGDGRYGWVAEAQGFYMVSFETPHPPEFPSKPGGLPVGRQVEIEEQTFKVVDRKETHCIGSEGELPFVAVKSRAAMSIDLTGPGGGFACAEYGDNETRFFVGRYAQYNELKFSDLRPVPGWSEEVLEPQRNQTSSLKCPNCGAPVVLRAAGLSMSATCGSCSSLIDTSTPELSLIRRAQSKQRVQPLIPIGRRGVLFDINYEIIGFQRIKDDYSGWFEYLLFSPWQGFIWLVNYNGHWSVVRRLMEIPEVSEGIFAGSRAGATFKGETHRLFATSMVSTEYVVGEFYWKVAVGMKVHVSDYINPPRILSCETYLQQAEETWSQGEYVEPEVIEKAFNLDQPLREPIGIYLNQPNPYAEKGRHLKWLVPLVLGLMVLIQIVSASRAANQSVYHGDFTYQAGVSNAAFVSEPFEIKGGNQAVEFVLNAPVDNNWLELGVDLVNAKTLQVVSTFEKGIEYYHGYDDGPWSEGHQQEVYLVPAVAPGQYYLTIDAEADAAVPQMQFGVTVVRDVVVWSNFWIAILLVLIYPTYCLVRSWMFERARWIDNEYAPWAYSTPESDD